uniref:Uncharacterized protein n=1 Tax=Oryza glumipatula TaxID=40148 RepID=A0A0E0A6D2_9ORYZ
MASRVAQIVLLAFSVAFSSLRSLESFLAAPSETTSPSLARGGARPVIAGALLFAILIAFELACLLLFAHVRGLGGGGGGGSAAVHGGFLAMATRRLAAAAVAVLLAGAVLLPGVSPPARAESSS